MRQSITDQHRKKASYWKAEALEARRDKKFAYRDANDLQLALKASRLIIDDNDKRIAELEAQNESLKAKDNVKRERGCQELEAQNEKLNEWIRKLLLSRNQERDDNQENVQALHRTCEDLKAYGEAYKARYEYVRKAFYATAAVTIGIVLTIPLW